MTVDERVKAGATLPVLANPDPCSGCGACCLHVVCPPFYRFGDPEWARLVAERPDLAAEVDADSERREAAGGPHDDAPCLWYDAESKRCRNHEYRPGICADYTPGGRSCLAERAEHAIPGPAPVPPGDYDPEGD